MWDWFIKLTQPQATLGAAALTFVGAVVAVLLGWLLFSAKVRDMRSALTTTDELVRAHKTSVEKTLTDIEAKISGLAAGAGQLRADVVDRQAASEEHGVLTEPGAAPSAEPAVNRPPADLFPAVEANWHAIRDHLEEIAADPSIDGRTAAKYQRIDRRSYADLINSLAGDNRLPNAPSFLEAARLWFRYRPRRTTPTGEDAARMAELARTLVQPMVQ